MRHLITDLRIAARSLRRHRGFTTVAVLTLALGAGATTAIFSVVYGVLLRPLPYADPDRIVSIWQTSRSQLGENIGGTVSHVNYLDWRRDARSFDALALYSPARLVVSGLGDAEVVSGGVVTPGFFRVFGASPAMGREFNDDEDRPGGPDVVIVSHAFWRDRLGGRADVLASTITVSGKSRAIVGVAPPGFDFPRGARIWAPVRNDDRACGRSCVYLNGVARLASGVSLASAGDEMDAISRRLEAQYPGDNRDIVALVRTLRDETVGGVRNAMLLLLGAVGMVLLIACANVANLLLVRGAGRTGEVAVRAALGAGRGRLISHLLAESFLLATAGSALGLVLGAWGVDLLTRVAPASVPRLDAIAFDAPTFLFGIGLMLVTAVLFGLGPAIQVSRAPLSFALGSRGDVTPGARRWTRRALLAAEVGLSLVVLLGAGLLLRSVAAMQAIDPGWKAAGVTTFTVSLPAARYGDDAAQRLSDTIVDRLASLPGSESAGRIAGLPLGRGEDVMNVFRRDRPAPAPGHIPAALYRVIDPGYFNTMGIAIVSGRTFTAADRPGAPGVVVISRKMAQQFFGDEDPIGRPMNVAGRDAEVIGVVSDVRSSSLTGEPQPELYVSSAQVPRRTLTYVVRSSEPPARVISSARAFVQSLDPQLPLISPETMGELLDRAMARPRFYLLLLSLFAILAVTLAAVGIYGVVAYAVSSRTREIGVRVALGASGGQVLRLVVGEGLRPACAGVAAGLGVAWLLGRAIAGELYRVRPHDPSTFAAMTLVLLGVVAAASAVPARRAARIPPADALRGG